MLYRLSRMGRVPSSPQQREGLSRLHGPARESLAGEQVPLPFPHHVDLSKQLLEGLRQIHAHHPFLPGFEGAGLMEEHGMRDAHLGGFRQPRGDLRREDRIFGPPQKLLPLHVQHETGGQHAAAGLPKSRANSSPR